MEDDAPPMGLSEDEAFDPAPWVKPLVALSVLILGGMTLLMGILGLALFVRDASTVAAWDFWGDPQLLGGLWLLAAMLMGLGMAALARRSDDSLALLILGVVVFVGTMLRAIIRFEGAGGPTMIILLMMVPFLALGGLQMEEPRRWLFHSREGVD